MGFRLLLQSTAEMSVVAEADSGEAACQLYLELKPDVVVMDLAMPGMGGLEALRRIRARPEACARGIRRRNEVAGREAVGERIRGVRPLGRRRDGAAHRLGFESFRIDHRHSSIQYQAKARRRESIRADADCHSPRAHPRLIAPLNLGYHVYELARAAGCSRVHWLTHETNTDAMLLYARIAERSGFVQYRRAIK